MKKLTLSALAFAAITLFGQPAFAGESHDHGSAAQAAPEETPVPDGAMCEHESLLREQLHKMRAQMAKINQTSDPKKRQKLLREHNKSMRDSIRMLREMMAEVAMGPAPVKLAPGGMMGGNMAGMKCDHGKGEPQASQVEGADAPANASAGPAKKLWVCPMHPDEVRDRPGICKMCGMDLVAKEELDAPLPGPRIMPDTMKCDHGMGGMKDCCLGGSGAKCNHMMGGMSGMPGRHMGAILALMEQLIAHNEAALSLRK